MKFRIESSAPWWKIAQEIVSVIRKEAKNCGVAQDGAQILEVSEIVYSDLKKLRARGMIIEVYDQED